ncbi:MAG: YabP/YqfC family sporulation protein [Clostridia bacterium]|nr:YabP/YqfC family sporulation protein [Clostridia bacterium]
MSKKRKPSAPALTAKDMFCEKLELPLSVVGDLSYMEVLGNNRVVLDGCKGVLEYTQDCICLSLSKGTIRFSGIDLCFKALNFEQAVISGKIYCIEFR